MSPSISARNGDPIKVPDEVSHLFNEMHFENYPKVAIPQEFMDHRGVIRNIADGQLGDVAIIESSPGAVRANHYHLEDWHFTYVVNGFITYEWTVGVNESKVYKLDFFPGDLIFTPSRVPHRMTFVESTTFVAVSKLSRMMDLYEKDTVRLEADFFNR